MAEFTYLDLQKAWKNHGFTQWQLAAAIGVSEDTVKSWVRTDAQKRVLPHPDDVSRIEHALGAEGEMLWARWMYSNVESYRERNPEPKVSALLEAVCSVDVEIEDVRALHSRLIRDAIDGHIDDPELRRQAHKEISEARAALARLDARIGKE